MEPTMQHDEAAELLRQRVGRPVATRLVEQLLRRTDGDRTLFAAIADQVDPDADGLHRAPVRWPQPEIESVRTMLAGVSAPGYQVLAAAAVIGREFDLSILELLCAEVDVLAGLDEVRSAGLIRPLPAQIYSFTRALTRDIVYDELPSRLRAELHERAAQALVEVGALGGARAVTVAELAHHTAEATLLGVGSDGAGQRRLDMAVAASATAGATAAADGADDLAAGYFAQAALLAGRAGWAPGPAGRLLAAAGAARLRSAGRAPAREVGRASLTGALRLGRRAADPGLLAAAAWGFGPRPTAGVFAPAHASPDTDTERLRALAEALTAQPAADEAALVARLTARLAAATADPELVVRALALARSAADPRALAEALLAAAATAGGSTAGVSTVSGAAGGSTAGGSTAGGVAELSRVPSLAVLLDDGELLARGYDALATMALRGSGGAVDRESALGYLDRLAELPARAGAGTALTRWYAARARVERAVLAGRFSQEGMAEAEAAGQLVDPAAAESWRALVTTAAGAAAAGPLDGLTAREREVLGWALRGVPARGIAQALVLGERTVETHLASIYRKLGVRTRVELMRHFRDVSEL
jgi:DNA-binding CsgD family transcriptional regulator